MRKEASSSCCEPLTIRLFAYSQIFVPFLLNCLNPTLMRKCPTIPWPSSNGGKWSREFILPADKCVSAQIIFCTAKASTVLIEGGAKARIVGVRLFTQPWQLVTDKAVLTEKTKMVTIWWIYISLFKTISVSSEMNVISFPKAFSFVCLM